MNCLVSSSSQEWSKCAPTKEQCNILSGILHVFPEQWYEELNVVPKHSSWNIGGALNDPFVSIWISISKL